jgi:multiple sugar transport system substrate-binding protein
MFDRRVAWMLLVVLVGGALLGACAPATEAPTTAPEQPTAAMPEPTAVPPTEAMTGPVSPMGDIDPSGQTVTFWHVWGTGDPNDAMLSIVDEFNSTNEWGITVDALDQGGYSDLEDAMNAAIQSGDVPSVVVGYTNALSNWYGVDSLVDLNPYISDPVWGMGDEASDFYQGTIQGGQTADGSQVGFPISQSANVVFYNDGWAQELGFDSPPANAEEFMTQACAAAEANNADSSPDNDGTGGLVLYAGASNVASFLFAYGGSILDDTGAGYDFTSDNLQQVAEYLKNMWDDGCAYPTESYPNPEFATRKAIFTMSSTAGIPYQVAAFDEADATDDVWSIQPFVGPDGSKAVDAFGQYLAVVNTTPEQTLASWLFLKYLTSPEVQAEWIRASAYYPTRMSTVDLLGDYASQNTYWAEGLDLVQYGQSEPSLPSWTTVRRDIQDSFDEILASDPGQIPDLLTALNTTAAEAVQEMQ